MSKFFSEYVDLTALIIIFLVPLLLTVFIKRKMKRHNRAAAVYALLFGPSSVLTLMFFHLFENAYHAIENAIAGRFSYNFHFYSLMLMGVVLAGIGAFLMRACLQKCTGLTNDNGRIFLSMFVVALVCLPLLPITPLSVVPIFCCLISLTGLFFVHRKAKQLKETTLPGHTTAIAD